MVPQEYVVETALQYFLYNWMCGLQPTLSVETLNGGNFSINVGVTTFQPDTSHSTSTPRPRRKRSGNAARKRRRERRACKSAGSSNVCTSEFTMSEHPEEAGDVEGGILSTACSTFSEDAITYDLIDLTASPTFTNEQLDYNNVTTDYRLKNAESISIARPSDQSGPSSDQSQVEIMLYSMVKELYYRTFKTDYDKKILGYGQCQDPTVCSRPAVGRP